VSGFVFSQNLQPKPIQFEQEDGVFISIDLMDSISLKLIDREVLIKENKNLTSLVSNNKAQIQGLIIKSDLTNSKALKFEKLYNLTEIQRDKAIENYNNQIIITKNVKKNRLGTVFYISEEVYRSDLLRLHCS